jgi:Flp pilus assembly protein TadD
MPSERADVLHELALAFARQGHRFAACGAARHAIAAEPRFLAAYVTLGRVRQQIGDRAGAVEAYEHAYELAPTDEVVLRGLAEAYRRANRVGEALEMAKRAVARAPDAPANLHTLANALLAGDHLERAARLYHDERRRAPGTPHADLGLGTVHFLEARWHAAAAAFGRAAHAAPGLAEIRYNRALLDLRFGRYRDGFANYGAIAETAGDAPGYYYLAADVPLWDGTPLHERRLLIAAEQGIGDHLMMARFFSRLPTLGAAIAIETPSPLVSLYRRAFPQLDILPRDRMLTPSAMDVHLPVMHLPGALRVAHAADFALRAPYLRPDPQRVAAARARLALDPSVQHVGIVWRGNTASPYDHLRTIPLPHWEPLAAVPGVRFHPLQVGTSAGELATAPFPLTPSSEHIADFDDLAAHIAVMDLVITVDTAAAHLAGAIGHPTWLATPLAADARWGVEGERTPWYPSVRLFRQPARNAWGAVFTAMADALRTRRT